MNKIIKSEEVVPNVHLIEIEAPRIAQKAKPGQFIIVMADEVGERIPFTISDWDAEKGTITMYMIEAGISTMKIAQKDAGDSLYSVVGPLGKATEIKNYGTVLLGGGCYGIGGIYPLARALKGRRKPGYYRYRGTFQFPFVSSGPAFRRIRRILHQHVRRNMR